MAEADWRPRKGAGAEASRTPHGMLRQCVGGRKQKPRAESDRKRKEPQKGLAEARRSFPPARRLESRGAETHKARG